jgi:hypothetical protein
MSAKDVMKDTRLFHGLWRWLESRKLRAEGKKRQGELHKNFKSLIANRNSESCAEIAVDLYRSWGDELDETRKSYLRSCIKEFQHIEGDVLISSASLLTLVLGAVSASDKSRRVWCMEHDSHWVRMLRSWLTQYAIKGTYILEMPLVVVSNLVRYQILTKHLPKNITTVFCERKGVSPGGTLSTLLTVSHHLAQEFTVFSRDVDLEVEGALLKQWARKNGASFVVVDKKDGFIKIARQHQARVENRAHFEGSEIPKLVDSVKIEAVG